MLNTMASDAADKEFKEQEVFALQARLEEEEPDTEMHRSQVKY